MVTNAQSAQINKYLKRIYKARKDGASDEQIAALTNDLIDYLEQEGLHQRYP